MDKLTYKTLEAPHFFEIPKIKGSRFFAHVFPLHSEQEIGEYLAELRKRYFDATHHCYAWRLGVQPQKDLFGNWVLSAKWERANDDGEPTNTAGKPILSVLAGEEIFDVLVVVTRYFGGTLLGVWGLIQAYTQASKAAIQTLTVVEKEITKKIKLTFGYDQLSSVQYLLSKYEGSMLEGDYADRITQTLSINLACIESFEKALIERQIQILTY